MSYLHWLLGISAGFVLLERWFPWRKSHPGTPVAGPEASLQ